MAKMCLLDLAACRSTAGLLALNFWTNFTVFIKEAIVKVASQQEESLESHKPPQTTEFF